MEKGDVYTRVTQSIIRAIEAGAGIHEMPWHRTSGGGMPRNPVTNLQYHGVNAVALWASAIHSRVSPSALGNVSPVAGIRCSGEAG
jgi:antirestriction protein ArdC